MVSQAAYNGGLAVEVLFLGRWLDAVSLGLYFYALSLASLIEVGVHWGAQHYVNREAAGRFDELRARLPALLALSCATVAIAAAAIGWRLGWALGAVAGAALVRSGAAMVGAVYIGRGRIWVPALGRLASPVVALPGLWLTVRHDARLESVSLVLLAATAAYAAPMALAGRSLGLGLPSAGSWRLLWRQWSTRLWPFVVLFFLGQLLYRVDGALVQWIVGETAVARYGLAFKWVEGFFFVPAVVASVAIPALVGRGPRQAASTLGTYTAALLLTLAAISAMLLIAGQPLLELLLGPAFTDSAPLFRMLVWALPFQGLGVLFGAALIAVHRERGLLVLTAVLAVAGTAAKSVALARWGLPGFAWTLMALLALHAAGAGALLARALRWRHDE